MSIQISRRDRLQVFERDGLMCAAASPDPEIRACSAGLTIQHRKNRGMGGGAAGLNAYPNLLTLCAWCNQRLESDAHFAELGRRMGWKLREGEDPSSVAVYVRWALEWRLLDGTGHASRVTARTAAEREARAVDPFADWRTK